MYENARIAVVIPCYRVEETVERVIRTLPDFVDVVIAVDDRSPDGTGALLDKLAGQGFANGPDLVVLHHSVNQGVGGAMATGYEQARSVVAALAWDVAAADRVQLVLPETGVCNSNAGDEGGGCCAPGAPKATSVEQAAAITADPKGGRGIAVKVAVKSGACCR